MNAGASSLVYS